MIFSDGGKVVEDKMLNAILEQTSFLAVFTGIVGCSAFGADGGVLT